MKFSIKKTDQGLLELYVSYDDMSYVFCSSVKSYNTEYGQLSFEVEFNQKLISHISEYYNYNNSLKQKKLNVSYCGNVKSMVFEDVNVSMVKNYIDIKLKEPTPITEVEYKYVDVIKEQKIIENIIEQPINEKDIKEVLNNSKLTRKANRMLFNDDNLLFFELFKRFKELEHKNDNLITVIEYSGVDYTECTEHLDDFDSSDVSVSDFIQYVKELKK